MTTFQTRCAEPRQGLRTIPKPLQPKFRWRVRLRAAYSCVGAGETTPPSSIHAKGLKHESSSGERAIVGHWTGAGGTTLAQLQTTSSQYWHQGSPGVGVQPEEDAELGRVLSAGQTMTFQPH